jgi:hypothetical protein
VRKSAAWRVKLEAHSCLFIPFLFRIFSNLTILLTTDQKFFRFWGLSIPDVPRTIAGSDIAKKKPCLEVPKYSGLQEDLCGTCGRSCGYRLKKFILYSLDWRYAAMHTRNSCVSLIDIGTTDACMINTYVLCCTFVPSSPSPGAALPPLAPPQHTLGWDGRGLSILLAPWRKSGIREHLLPGGEKDDALCALYAWPSQSPSFKATSAAFLRHQSALSVLPRWIGRFDGGLPFLFLQVLLTCGCWVRICKTRPAKMGIF